jgi:hypothetical protein
MRRLLPFAALLALISSVDAQSLPDADADGVPDLIDNCTVQKNPEQIDDDIDGFGNRCDADLDESGVVTINDFNLFRTCFLEAANNQAFNLSCDFDGSRTITGLDAKIFSALYGKKPGPSAF